MERIERVLFVCTGNMCRSPMAEGLLRSLLDSDGESGRTEVSSAGTWGCVGQGAAELAIEVCRERGIDISNHRARMLEEAMIRESDLVLVMETDHLWRVLDLVPDAGGKTMMLGQFGLGRQDRVEPIPDPFGRSRGEYEKCFEIIERHVRALHEQAFRQRGGIEREDREQDS